MSINLVSAFLTINDNFEQALFSMEVRENKIEILNVSGRFISFYDTREALDDMSKALNLLEKLGDN